MTVTNGKTTEQGAAQPAAETDDKMLYRQVAEIYHDAGIRSSDELLRAAAQTDPEIFAGVRDALGEVEAEREAGG